MGGAGRSGQRERSRTRILEAAARIAAERGFHGMSMRDLAQATGQSLANLYNYFPAKDDLLFALQSRAFETLIATAEAAVGSVHEPEARLYAFVLNHVRYVTSHPRVMRVLVQEAGTLSPAPRRAIRALKERYFDAGRAVVRGLLADHDSAGRAFDDAEQERATYSIFGMLNWVYGWYDAGRHGTPTEVARGIHRIALSGLLARRPDQAVQAAMERRAAGVATRSPLALAREA
jgi:TetR/AcrR family transcriptional regulator, cholesterol catabolism regulator